MITWAFSWVWKITASQQPSWRIGVKWSPQLFLASITLQCYTSWSFWGYFCVIGRGSRYVRKWSFSEQLGPLEREYKTIRFLLTQHWENSASQVAARFWNESWLSRMFWRTCSPTGDCGNLFKGLAKSRRAKCILEDPTVSLIGRIPHIPPAPSVFLRTEVSMSLARKAIITQATCLLYPSDEGSSSSSCGSSAPWSLCPGRKAVPFLPIRRSYFVIF